MHPFSTSGGRIGGIGNECVNKSYINYSEPRRVNA